MTRWREAAIVAGAGVVAAVGIGADDYLLLACCRILALGLVAIAVHQLSAGTGMASLGHGAYFGAGAYATAIALRGDFTSAPLHLVIAALAGAFVAGAAAFALVRLRGLTYLVASLAVGLLAATVASSWKSVTGGSDGIAAPAAAIWPIAMTLTDPRSLYVWVLAVSTIGLIVVIGWSRSPFGAALTGIGDSEARMRALGYPVGIVLWRAHVASGAVAGCAGALWVQAGGYIAPHDLGLATGAIALAAAAIGERRGPIVVIVATAALVSARDLAGSYIGPAATQGPLLFGLALLLAAFLPVMRRRVRL